MVEIQLNEPVITEMAGAGRGIYEDTKQYLLKLRHPEAFAPIMTEVETKPWHEIRFERKD